VTFARRGRFLLARCALRSGNAWIFSTFVPPSPTAGGASYCRVSYKAFAKLRTYGQMSRRQLVSYGRTVLRGDTPM